MSLILATRVSWSRVPSCETTGGGLLVQGAGMLRELLGVLLAEHSLHPETLSLPAAAFLR